MVNQTVSIPVMGKEHSFIDFPTSQNDTPSNRTDIMETARDHLDKIAPFILSILISLISWTAQGVEYNKAVLLESPLPKHPYETYVTRDLDSGMVELVFIVDETGMPTKIEIVRSSLSYLEHQAIKAVEKYKFQPATFDSKPVQSRHTARVEFDHSRIGRISGFTNPMDAPEGYKSLYNKLKKELVQEEPSERKAANTLKKIRKLAYKTFFTSVHTELAQHQFAMKFGTKHQQLEPLLNIMMYEDVEWGGNRALDADTKLTIQFGILKLMLDLGHHAEALDKYDEYSKNSPSIVEAFSSYIDKIRDIQRSETVIERRVTLPIRGYSFLPLLKRSFVIDRLDGQIDTFDLKCEAKYAQFTFKQDAQYQLPTAWGRCELQINGKPGSIASILQQ